MNQSQIKIGTSAWGSKISIKDAINLGLNLTNFGINHFDAAPNYGSGYCHYVLNELGKKKKFLWILSTVKILILILKNLQKGFIDLKTLNHLNIHFRTLNSIKMREKVKIFGELIKLKNHLVHSILI